MKFYQIHVPKTGGMSLQHYGINNSLSWDATGGHRSYSERDIPNEVIKITCLRCPIQQTISIYSFWKDGTSLYRPVKNMQPFSEWIRNPVELKVKWPSGDWKWFPNLYTSFFGDGNFDKTIEVLNYVDFVLDTSDLTNQFNERVVKKYNLPKFDLFINKSKSIDISKDDIECIKKTRRQDLEICKRFNIKTEF